MTAQAVGGQPGGFDKPANIGQQIIAQIRLQQAFLGIEHLEKCSRRVQADAESPIDFRLLHLLWSQPPAVGTGKLHFIAVAECQ